MIFFILACSDSRLHAVEEPEAVEAPDYRSTWARPFVGYLGFWAWTSYQQGDPFYEDFVVVADGVWPSSGGGYEERLVRLSALTGEVDGSGTMDVSLPQGSSPVLTAGGRIVRFRADRERKYVQTILDFWTFEVIADRGMTMYTAAMDERGLVVSGSVDGAFGCALLDMDGVEVWSVPWSCVRMSPHYLVDSVNGVLLVRDRSDGTELMVTPLGVFDADPGLPLEFGNILVTRHAAIDLTVHEVAWWPEGDADRRCDFFADGTPDRVFTVEPHEGGDAPLRFLALDAQTGLEAEAWEIPMMESWSASEADLCPSAVGGEGLWVLEYETGVVFIDGERHELIGVNHRDDIPGETGPFIRRLSTGERFVGLPRAQEFLGFVFGAE